MSDTVPGTAIAGSLDSGGWTFLPLPDATQPSDALHVNGAAHADPVPAGLLVEFRTLSPDLQLVPAGASPIDPSPSVVGSYALLPDAQPAIVAGALQLGG